MDNYTTLYHGTCSYIDEWDFLHSGENTSNNAGGIYFTDSRVLATSYSIDSYIRAHEYECEDIVELYDLAQTQAHIYKCEIDTSQCLHLSQREVALGSKSKRNPLFVNTLLVNAIVGILKGHEWSELLTDVCGEENYIYEAQELLSYYLLEYDEELDDYIEKDVHYNCICLHDIVDSCTEEVDIASNVYIVLDTDIIKSTNLIKC